MSRRLLLVLLLAGPLFLWHLDRPGFSDTEGMFSEPAREMVVTGDWVTPRMNGAPFLTKPPLTYWLAAALFTVTGPTERARLWPVLAALGTVAATGALGTLLFGEAVGTAAAVILATSVGFFVESRLLRADMILVLAVTLALLSYVRLWRGRGVGAALALWASIGLGVLDKGLLAVLLPGGIIVVAEIMEGVLRPRTVAARLRALHVPLGIAVVIAIAGPWHLLAAHRNPGFLWDYVVNQHLLFFFDEKLPRDSIPDSLGFFLAMFLVRGLPWSVLLPAACVHARRVVRGDPARACAMYLLTAWVLVVVGFFSLAPSRLEHYSLPALPAVALLVGAFLADARRSEAIRWAVPSLAMGALVVLAVLLDSPSHLLFRLEPALAGFGLEALVRVGAGLLVVALGGMALLLAARRGPHAIALGAAATVGVLLAAQIAHERVEALFSWRPFARIIHRSAPDGARVFFRASDEYQLCGGLAYYLERRLDLLAPAGWVPPTFLAGRTEQLFTPAPEFARAWHEGGAFFVSDDVEGPGAERNLVPGPHVVMAREGSRVLLYAGRRDGLGTPPGGSEHVAHLAHVDRPALGAKAEGLATTGNHEAPRGGARTAVFPQVALGVEAPTVAAVAARPR